jgi:UDPglucose 6-dehydrogenase
MKIGIIGCGYVGVVTSLGLAHLGYSVVGVETNPDRLSALQDGRLPMYEPGLSELFERVREAGRVQFTDSIAEALRECEILFICVGTPAQASGEPDLSQIEAVIRCVGEALPDGSYRIMVNKSTVPVGSADYVRAMIEEQLEERSEADRPTVEVVSNPEFLREGSAIQDMLYPDRVVVGASSEKSIERMRALYEPLLSRRFERLPGLTEPPKPAEWIETDPLSAELTKYAANAFLAMKISFINEIGGISERIGADIRQVAKGIGADSRIGKSFLQAGIGWGGSCFRKDILALSHLAWEHNCSTGLLDSTLKVNELQRAKAVQVLQTELKILKGKTVAVLGVSFKPNTDDCRDAPALIAIHRLLELGAWVRAYDPQARFTEPDRPTFKRLSDPYAALKGADAAVVMTEWKEIRGLDPARAADAMSGRLLLDGRNCMHDANWKAEGFKVIGFGR